MKKWFCGILSLMLVFASVCGLADARMPADRGALTDDADVLSKELSSAIVEYADDVKEETDVDLHVAIVHFLDGLDAQTYANQLFTKWELGDDDALLLCAAGEDTFATVLGREVEKDLGKQNMDNLMYTSSAFAEHIAALEYDLAFAKYFEAFNELANKRYDEKLKLPKTISQLAAAGAQSAEQSQTVAANPLTGLSLWNQITSGVTGNDPDANVSDYMPNAWWNTMENVQDNSEQYVHYQQNDDSNGIGVGGWIILMILVSIIFSQSHPVRKARRNYRSNHGGKGRNPVGLIFGLFGLSSLLGLFRKR